MCSLFADRQTCSVLTAVDDRASVTSTPSSTNQVTVAAAANSPKPARHIFAGHSSKPPCTRIGQPTLTLPLYRATRERRSTAVARLTIAGKIGKRVYHALHELELAAA
jgi:hypothetical protein